MRGENERGTLYVGGGAWLAGGQKGNQTAHSAASPGAQTPVGAGLSGPVWLLWQWEDRTALRVGSSPVKNPGESPALHALPAAGTHVGGSWVMGVLGSGVGGEESTGNEGATN